MQPRRVQKNQVVAAGVPHLGKARNRLGGRGCEDWPGLRGGLGGTDQPMPAAMDEDP